MESANKIAERGLVGKHSPAVTRNAANNSANSKTMKSAGRTIKHVPIPVLQKEQEDWRKEKESLKRENDDLRRTIELLRQEMEAIKNLMTKPPSVIQQERPIDGTGATHEISSDDSDCESVANQDIKMTKSKTKRNMKKSVRSESKKLEKQIPAVIVFSDEVKTITQEIEKETEEFQVVVKPKRKFHVKPKNMEAHAKVMSKLKDMKVECVTFAEKSATLKKFVLKGLTNEEDVEQLKNEIEAENNIKIEFVKQILTRGRKTANYIVFVKQDVPNTDVLKIRSVGRLIVRWETYFSTDIPSCRNCKRWGHFAKRCQRNYRCSKCDKGHEYGKCEVLKDAPKEAIKCVNCKKSGHPATYKGCEIYTKVWNDKFGNKNVGLNRGKPATYASAAATSTRSSNISEPRTTATTTNRDERLEKRLDKMGEQITNTQYIIVKLLEKLNVTLE